MAQEEQRVVRARVEAGDLAPVERSRVDALVVQAETSLLSAENDARRRAIAIALVIGETPGQSVEPHVGAARSHPTRRSTRIGRTGGVGSNPTVRVGRLNEETAG